MTEFNLEIVLVLIVGVGQKFGDFGEFGEIATGFPVATDPVIRMNQVEVDKMTTKRVWSLGRKLVRRRIGR